MTQPIDIPPRPPAPIILSGSGRDKKSPPAGLTEVILQVAAENQHLRTPIGMTRHVSHLSFASHFPDTYDEEATRL
jgi:hypothetical protein